VIRLSHLHAGDNYIVHQLPLGVVHKPTHGSTLCRNGRINTAQYQGVQIRGNR
jgi:hypothetical protein